MRKKPMEYLTHILTFIFGLGTGWTFNVIISRSTTKNVRRTSVTQKEIVAGGDVIGGDSHKR